MTDDYELLPHEELEDLRKEVERIKKSPFPDSKKNETLMDAMKALTMSINKLIKIFEGAQEELIQEYTESSPTKILKQISEQNAKIAQGIVALANMIKEQQEPPEAAKPLRPMIPPMASTPNFTPPTMSPPPYNPAGSMQNPEMGYRKNQRKGMFDSFKK